MRMWFVLGLIAFSSSFWVVADSTPAIAGFSEQRACEDKLFSQGLRRRDVESHCEVCFLKPESSACRTQFRGGSSEGSSSGSGSIGRSGGGSSSGPSDGPDTSGMRKLGRNSETGASYECVDRVAQERGRYSDNVTIQYKNVCGHTVIVEDVCRNIGKRPVVGNDKLTVFANSSSRMVCE
jgi:hypothetical protein